jgi:hypothetical protein
MRNEAAGTFRTHFVCLSASSHRCGYAFPTMKILRIEAIAPTEKPAQRSRMVDSDLRHTRGNDGTNPTSPIVELDVPTNRIYDSAPICLRPAYPGRFRWSYDRSAPLVARANRSGFGDRPALAVRPRPIVLNR